MNGPASSATTLCGIPMKGFTDMTSRCLCERCQLLLAKGGNARLHFKNKVEEIVVTGTDFTVSKVCRRCGAVNVLRCPSRR
jgi:hypothetical protein